MLTETNIDHHVLVLELRLRASFAKADVAHFSRDALSWDKITAVGRSHRFPSENFSQQKARVTLN